MHWLFEPLDHRPEDADVELSPMDHGIGGQKTSQYSDAAARVALARAARGETIAAILTIPGMPSRRTLYDWIRDVPRFGQAWREMRDRQALARQGAVEDANRCAPSKPSSTLRFTVASRASSAGGRAPTPAPLRKPGAS